MGQKTNPIGLRLGINRDWDSVWFDEKNFADKIHEDMVIRRFIDNKLSQASIASVQISRSPKKVQININTANIDPEISSIPGPQLVVPLSNTRYAINAANSRWGSLYDALYGTDMISESDGAIREGGYNPIRGNRVIAFAKNFLAAFFKAGFSL